MGHTAQRGFDASRHYWHIGKQLFQNVAIHNGGIVGACSGPAIGRVGIIAATATIGGVVIHHRVHGPRAHAKKQPWRPQFLEIAQVVAPVGLRHNGNIKSMCLKHTTNHGCSHRGVIDIGITAKQDHINMIPAQVFDFLVGGGEPLPFNVSVIFAFIVVYTHRVQLSSSQKVVWSSALAR